LLEHAHCARETCVSRRKLKKTQDRPLPHVHRAEAPARHTGCSILGLLIAHNTPWIRGFCFFYL